MTRSARARTALVLVASLFGLSGCSLAQLGTSPRPNAIPTVVAPTPAPTPGPTAVPKTEPRETSQPDRAAGQGRRRASAPWWST